MHFEAAIKWKTNFILIQCCTSHCAGRTFKNRSLTVRWTQLIFHISSYYFLLLFFCSSCSSCSSLLVLILLLLLLLLHPPLLPLPLFFFFFFFFSFFYVASPLFRAMAFPVSFFSQVSLLLNANFQLRIWSKFTAFPLTASSHSSFRVSQMHFFPAKRPHITYWGVRESSLLTTWPAQGSLLRLKNISSVTWT